ncbi:hypothetical protein [Tsukamurella spumae]|uniref:hypothetical protein n=1 Tax=Tsukamurella spumae TaxID=44753 RepID=UPI0028ABBE51|nr:hypothetical protein [Tsukamurella spumae]
MEDIVGTDEIREHGGDQLFVEYIVNRECGEHEPACAGLAVDTTAEVVGLDEG